MSYLTISFEETKNVMTPCSRLHTTYLRSTVMSVMFAPKCLFLVRIGLRPGPAVFEGWPRHSYPGTRFPFVELTR